MEFEEKLAKLAKINKDRSDQLERNKNIWIQEVNNLYKNIGNWFAEYIKKGYMSVDYDNLQVAECEEFLMNTQIMRLNLGGEQGPSVIFEPTGINIVGAMGKIDLYYRGHKDEGVFLLLFENGEKFHWEIWKSRKQQEDIMKFNEETLKKMIDEWLEKWIEI
ncbi:MAG: hypothetical protein GY749_01705 [Desulfobacteraceae bacterium]|nr:hypothetical protein [Desulfobacteraceae bacterium]